MWRIVHILLIVSMVCFFVLGCCKKKTEPEPGQEVLKSAAEYKAEAEREITEENMKAELEKIEKEL